MTKGLPFIGRCILLLLFFAFACNKREERKVQRSFYYWKTNFSLSGPEKATLHQLAINKLYVKFFDVDWEEASHSAKPIAKSIFRQTPPAGLLITPVVFITQEPLQKTDSTGLKQMAVNIARLVSSISTNNHLSLSQEVQFDCDWTANTREAYFYLLNQLKQQAFFRGKIISVTIRLHQLKFLSQNGVPPVHKGLLMCYNMGNLRYPQTKNSIIAEEELKKYINTLPDYPLPLDVALPVFDWYILFDQNQYRGLLRDFNPGKELALKERIVFDRDTMIDGYSFKKGQWLRHETSNASIVKKCAGLVSEKLKGKELTVILYYLNQDNLVKYNQNELESFFDSFH